MYCFCGSCDKHEKITYNHGMKFFPACRAGAEFPAVKMTKSWQSSLTGGGHK